jgi:MOSC domain-containing protein YiiM
LKDIKITQLRTGRLRLFSGTDTLTGIYKEDTPSAFLSAVGLENDEQGDKKNHGGPEKALHHYAADHYTWLKANLPSPASEHCLPGAFGENLVSIGLTERDVCVGDVFQLGGAVIEVSQPRQPCWRLNQYFGIQDMSHIIQNSLRTGWYYRVLQPGQITVNDTLHLQNRPLPDWTLHRILELLYKDTMNRQALTALSNLTGPSPNLRNLAIKRLQTGNVENWQGRLYGPALRT